jgi:hypothetical protein
VTARAIAGRATARVTGKAIRRATRRAGGDHTASAYA